MRLRQSVFHKGSVTSICGRQERMKIFSFCLLSFCCLLPMSIVVCIFSHKEIQSLKVFFFPAVFFNCSELISFWERENALTTPWALRAFL